MLKKLKKTTYPVFATVALALAFSFNGCTCSAQMGSPPKAAEPPPVPPPAPAPEASAAPAPTVVAPRRIRTIGKAKIEDGQIKIPGKLEFDVDKATIRNDPGSTEILTTVAEVLKQNPSVNKIRIEGHTDNTGTPDHNRSLSKERADAVAKFLTDHGIDKGRLETAGHGQDKPLVANDTPANKQSNRRTEFHIVEVDGKPFAEPAANSATTSPAATTPKK
jgi:OmpA-OmpF porin, OOP family